jgi:hypothetical protein
LDNSFYILLLLESTFELIFEIQILLEIYLIFFNFVSSSLNYLNIILKNKFSPYLILNIIKKNSIKKNHIPKQILNYLMHTTNLLITVHSTVQNKLK